MSDAAMDPPPNPPPPVVKIEQAEKNNNPSSSNHITLRVKDQNQNEVLFRIKKSVPLKMLMDGYCVKKRVELNSFAFLVDGNNLRRDQTPEEAGLEDNDEIDVFDHQLGVCIAGCCYFCFMLFLMS
ncbi:hypothetical protein LWI28_012087 [Acer negundo]|uniref:Small ubiquitin-related modifier n=1 Tax=Acer negundo TaxID=4023 RepID=A0AAD5J933_ACENE|nr:hypothetical protein LWI28_012087 [Acer negundo]KAK4852496.1 hypothetical protein QYF36_024656 [Acer negundo]